MTKGRSAQKDVRDATAKLADFIRRNACSVKGLSDEEAGNFLILIREALSRFEKTHLLRNADISARAEQLAKTAAAFAKEIKRSAALHEDSGILRDGDRSIWPYLRIAETIGGDTVFSHDIPSALRFGETLYSARRFSNAVGSPAALYFHAQALERQALKAKKVFSRRGRAADLARNRLHTELEMLWANITGKSAGHSGSGINDDPRTTYGNFVKLAVEAEGWAAKRRNEVVTALINATKKRKPRNATASKAPQLEDINRQK